MDYVYLIYGENDYLIKTSINKIIKKDNYYDIIHYDMSVDKIENILDEANKISLFGNKLIICNNCKFLSRQKSDIEQNIDLLINYLDNINEYVILILSNNNIDNSKKIIKKLKEKAKIIECSNLTDNELRNIIIKKFNKEGYKIDISAANKLIELTLSDMYAINLEINKLLMYKLDDKIIDIHDVENLVAKRVEDNIFDLIDATINNNKKKIFSIYKMMINDLNYEPIKILIMIANQIRLILQVKVMTNAKYTENDISTKLGIHPYRVKIAKLKSKKFSIEKLKKYLLDLSLIDYKIKSGKGNKNAELELFFLNL